MQLPNGWLWDMVDEFVYQFQSWQQYRGKLTTKSAEEIEALRSCDNVWSILSVLNYLQALADKSGIAEELSTAGESPTLPLMQGPDQLWVMCTNALQLCWHAFTTGIC